MSLNKVMLIGNVGKDPEIRYLEGSHGSAGNAVKVASFSFATTEKYKDRNGVLKESTEWHNIVAWRGLADFVEKYVKKGAPMYIEGSIRSHSWQDREGNSSSRVEIVAETMQFVGRRQDDDKSRKPAPAPAAIDPPAVELPEDDIPF